MKPPRISAQAPTPVPIRYSGPPPGPWPEVTPCTAGARVWVSTDRSYIGRWQHGTIVCEREVCAPEPEVPWRRSYAGVHSAVEIGGMTFAFVHGENKNEIVAGTEHVNTITADRSCFSGVQPDGSYRDCWADYFAFASMNRDGVDEGPVVWPKGGYLDATGRVVSHGCRHPYSAIVSGGQVYLFYLDMTVGICVARAPAGSVRPGMFQTWCGASLGWHPSLPPGPFRARLSKPGPPAVPILGSRASFTFAAVKLADGFLALEHGATSTTTVAVRAWTSRDIVHWKPRPGLLWPTVGNDVASAWDACTVRGPRPVDDGLALATDGTHVSHVHW